MKLVNNTFISSDGSGAGRVNCSNCGTIEAKNNIFQGNYGGTSRINEGFTSTNSIWDIGALGYSAGSGNQQIAPQFLGSGAAIGADGKPFTSDDSYQLRSTSPGVNAGVTVSGRTTDILGNAIVGTPDIGAYEYGGTVQPPTVTITKSGTGTGTVTSTGSINCGTTCTSVGTAGQTVTLTATAGANSTFAGWTGTTGTCAGTTSPCSFTLNANTTVNAVFNTVSTYTVTKGAVTIYYH